MNLLEFGFIKLTLSEAPVGGEAKAGDTIHVCLHRTQAYYKVWRDGKRVTRFTMNSESKDYKLIYYVEETPKEIRQQVEGAERDKIRKYDDED